jgi:dipeptidyl aminopeptidase/acylaminoacyl peptidase
VSQEGAKKIDLLAAGRNDGRTRSILAEDSKTFLDVSLTLPNSSNFTDLGDNRRFLWLSERDGWSQIYLYSYDGALIRKLTEERRPVERIATVDVKNGWIYYTAHGGEGRPYDFRLYRANLNRGGIERLTPDPGQHDIALYDAYLGEKGVGIRFSPSLRFFLDTHSDVNRPPETDLRRADGSLVDVISKAEAGGLSVVSPGAPEEFTVKAADGATDLCGLLYKPLDFRAGAKYPVVDFIYGGPQMTRVRRTFADGAREQAFANLGLILFVVDGRGTPGRGKAFQDVVYRNLGRNEIPDHVAVLKQIAAARPYMDLKRVAVLGGSFGGYFAIRAMLQAPEIFQVGIALAPSEADESLRLWMGSREGNPAAYEYASNLPLAKNLAGSLLIVHGTSDVNAPLAGTMRMVDALEQAGKVFDLILLPEKDHTAQNSSYSLQRVRNYLVEHLRL